MFKGDVGQGAFIWILLGVDEGGERLQVGGFQPGLREEPGAGKNSELSDLGNIGMAQAPEGEELLPGGFGRLLSCLVSS